jgi:hypothetical protein
MIRQQAEQSAQVQEGTATIDGHDPLLNELPKDGLAESATGHYTG